MTGNLRFNAIAAGGRHTCGVQSSTSEVFCWGLNTSGELATGALDNGTSIPGWAFWTMFGLSGRLRLVTLSLGDHHSCGLSSYGTAWCWGDGLNGQLGNGGFAGSAMAVRVWRPR